VLPGGFVQPGKLVRGEDKFHSPGALFSLVNFRRPGDGDNSIPGKIDHPVQRNLPDGTIMEQSDLFHNSDQRSCSLDSAFQTGSPNPAFLFQRFRVLVILAGQ
jgi:hypothetical protein